MITRPATADISYPFVPEVPDRKYIAGILDARLQIQGDVTLTTGSSGSKTAYTYLSSLTQVAGEVHYVFTSIFNYDTTYAAYTTTFEVTPGQGLVGVTNVASEETIGYLLINSNFIYQSGDLTITSPDYELEPCTVAWFNNTISTVNFVNEYRQYNPAARGDLTNTVVKTFTAPEDIKVASGYNVSLTYGSSSGILDIDGSPGNGLGVAPDNMWDVGPSWSSDTDGVISINGINRDDEGNIDITGTNSVTFVKSTGSIDIEVL